MMAKNNERMTTRMRALLARPGCLVTPGVADAFAARMVKMEGFEAVYMTGFGTTLSRLGMPDVGLLTANEMIDRLNADEIGSDTINSGYGVCPH